MTLATSRVHVGRRRLIGFGVALAAASLTMGTSPLTANAGKTPAPLPTPTNVVVSGVTAQSFQVKVGSGTTLKLYDVFLNGTKVSGGQASSTVGFPVTGLTQSTTYSLQVRQYVLPSGNTSALSAPISVRTLAYVAPVLPAAPTSVATSQVTSESATLTWTASPGAVSYRVYQNGVARETTSATSLVVGPINGFPNPIAGSGLRPGRTNRLGVEAINAAGVASRVSEVFVTTPGVAAPAPTAPAGLVVTAVFNNRILVNWAPSTDAVSDPTQISYRLYLDGRFVGYTCSQYCFGTTGASAIGLAPGTAYRIGIEAVNGTGGVSDIAEIIATTIAP